MLVAPTAVPTRKKEKGISEQHRAQLSAVIDLCSFTSVRVFMLEQG